VDNTFLQQYVKKQLYAHLHCANLVSDLTKSISKRDFMHLPVKPPKRLLDISDASHAGNRTRYANEVQTSLLTSETSLQLKPEANELTAEELRSFLSSSSAAHLLFGSGKTAKRISHNTFLGLVPRWKVIFIWAKNSSSGHASMIATRLTETGLPRAPTIDEQLELEVDRRYDVPIDSLTDCRDLCDLATSAKSVPQDKTQRFYFLSVREKITCANKRRTTFTETDMLQTMD
jgi:hypothetical protein